jgi:polyisoprenyl-phosphate glycosyltransferase
MTDLSASSGTRKMISVVVPAWNEIKVIDELCRRLEELMVRQPKYDFEIIIVENGSWDGSWERLQEIHKKDKRFKNIQLSRNFMADGGVMAGLNMASGDAAVVMNADLQDPPELVDRFIEKWEEGFEIIYGVIEGRQGESLFKVLASDWYYKFVHWITRGAIPKGVSDFRLMDRKVYLAVNHMREHNRFTRGLSVWTGFRQTGIPFIRPARFAGETKAPLADLIEESWNGVLAYSHIPLRLPLHVGWLLMLISLVVALTGYLDETVQGMFSDLGIPALILALFGGVFVSIGLVGAYLAQIHDEVRNRPNYVIRQAEGFEPPLEEIEHFGGLIQRRRQPE